MNRKLDCSSLFGWPWPELNTSLFAGGFASLLKTFSINSVGHCCAKL